MSHIILAGDSIFDNAGYVPGEPPVIEQLRGILPYGTEASLLAVDGDFIENVSDQLNRMPKTATHLFVSAGGNNALDYNELLQKTFPSSSQLLVELANIQDAFRKSYRTMLKQVTGLKKKLTVCTIYDAVPGLGPAEVTALSILNDVIIREASSFGIPVIDLRQVCSEPSDYSELSPIEPSALGGSKIARSIARVFLEHDFRISKTTVYA